MKIGLFFTFFKPIQAAAPPPRLPSVLAIDLMADL
jgi:hypothetical protein